MKCLKCNEELADSSLKFSEETLCKKCQKNNENSDHVDSFDFDQGYNLDEVYD
jgi:hypothetical protein